MACQYQNRLQARYADLFFHPNVCYVCKHIIRTQRFLCECRMISYCCESDEHRNNSHMMVCEAIKTLHNQVRKRRLFLSKFSVTTLDEWNRYNKKRSDIIEEHLRGRGYNMSPYEKDIIRFSRSCHVCYKEDNLQPCSKCFSVNYCEAHRNSDYPHQCEKLKEWLYTEIQAIDAYPVPQYYRGCHEFPDTPNVTDMRSFYKEYILPKKDASLTILDKVYSDYLSGPLTVYYGMQNAEIPINSNVNNTYVIHIIGATYVDKEALTSWEIFLHTFNVGTRLTVVIIGSNLRLTREMIDSGAENEFDTCWEKCKPSGHTLHYQIHCKKYETYTKEPEYVRPDLLVGFDTQPISWKSFIKILLNNSIRCPVILMQSAKNTRMIVKAIRDEYKVTPVLNRKNKFKGLRLYRNLENGLYYRNSHLIIYNHLCLSSPPKPQKPKFSLNVHI